MSADSLLKRAFKLKSATSGERIRTISIARGGDYGAAEKHAITTGYARQGDLIVFVHRFCDEMTPE